MKKRLLFALILVMNISLYGCVSYERDEQAVASLVLSFGSKLQQVSLLASQDVLKNSMKENYRDYVSPTLLAEWLGNPLIAPGRLTSSPWPDRIEIQSIERLSTNKYSKR